MLIKQAIVKLEGDRDSLKGELEKIENALSALKGLDVGDHDEPESKPDDGESDGSVLQLEYGSADRPAETYLDRVLPKGHGKTGFRWIQKSEKYPGFYRVRIERGGGIVLGICSTIDFKLTLYEAKLTVWKWMNSRDGQRLWKKIMRKRSI